MQRKMRALKYKINRRFQRFLKRLAWAFKLGFSVFILFLASLFLLSRPSEIVSDYFVNHFDQLRNESYMTEEEFITFLTPLAKEVEKTHGTRPSLLIAQAALESDWGNSGLSKEAHNYFGIKGSNGTHYATKEYYDNDWEDVRASFKVYDSAEDSVVDYADLLKNGTSWDADFYRDVITAANYQEAAHAVQKAGYATDPDYAQKLIHIIEQYHLYEIDD